MPSLDRSPLLGRTTSRWALAALLTVAAVATCERPAAGQEPESDGQTSWYGSSVADLLRDTLISGWRGRTGTDAGQLRRLYEQRNYEPIWTGSPQAEANAKLMLEALGGAENEGLRPHDYQAEQLSAMAAAGDPRTTELELLLTDSLLRYARDVRLGRVQPVDVDLDIGLPRLGFDFGGALAVAFANGTLPSFLAELAPKHRDYQRLKQALKRYRAIEAAGGWPSIPSGTAPDGENANLLRARLTIEDESAVEGDVTEALKRYQDRNALAPDGVLGPRTLEALNVPVATRINQIKANMERWRWMPRELEPRRIDVNVAAATLQFVDTGTTLLHSNVVVGGLNRRTPILRAEAIAVTVNPTWYVPASIAWREIRPKLLSNPYYLQSQGMILSGGRVRQPPGPRNALGTIKIEMPNDFGVYLHDTPTKAAFRRQLRTLSHGCVRVEQIAPLASLAISGDAESAMGELTDIIATGKTTRIHLGERIPVYLLYWTAVADDEGHAGFPTDVYSRDPLLVAALNGVRLAPRLAAELGP